MKKNSKFQNILNKNTSTSSGWLSKNWDYWTCSEIAEAP